ncbi:hypothetical protein [Paenibacillus durus]|uniref:DUF4309 domain-containing protein n=1 Tax=Paenibacillus durus TaxID=44251 RepID=A0A089HX66_PAEDU|nr:hypothetical protein [Paenibacillus durus]AIQ14928.1 hypothetical protein PDUR_25885 [Paenibacillus durus]
MKAVKLLIFLMVIILQSSCVNKNGNYITKQTYQTSEHLQSKESTINIATSSNYSKSKDSINKTTFEVIHHFFNIKRGDALKLSKTDSSEDTIAIMESHMNFPCVFVEDLGVTFIYQDFSEDSLPAYISVNSDTNSSSISVGDVKPGMSFVEIKRIMGEKKVKKTWIASEDITAYVLEYIINGYKFSFQSYQEDGEASELYISEV